MWPGRGNLRTEVGMVMASLEGDDETGRQAGAEHNLPALYSYFMQLQGFFLFYLCNQMLFIAKVR